MILRYTFQHWACNRTKFFIQFGIKLKIQSTRSQRHGHDLVAERIKCRPCNREVVGVIPVHDHFATLSSPVSKDYN